mmetsp:Transcript_16366/g.30551  ORF Transcript_16366/g.30551 Transcript_16366/m.30551 type:complete len:134 (+) Transcript_16366:103-504(+)
MWSEFGKDFRLIKKHFRRNISRNVRSDFIFNLVGFGLVSSLCLSMILQRDIAQEGFELLSPFRYDSPSSVYFPVYRMLSPVKSDIDENKVNEHTNKAEKKGCNSDDSSGRKDARFPSRSSIPVLVDGKSENTK